MKAKYPIRLSIMAFVASSCIFYSCKTTNVEESGLQSTQSEWLNLQSASYEAVKQHVEEHKAKGLLSQDRSFNRFQNFPLGFTGIPLVIFKALPHVSDLKIRAIFGGPNDNYAPMGFGKMPPEDFSARHISTLPLGLGTTGSDLSIKIGNLKPSLSLSVLTCGNCHIGRVKFTAAQVQEVRPQRFFGYDPAAASLYLVGAPNIEFDTNYYRHCIEKFSQVMQSYKKNDPDQFAKVVGEIASYIENASVEDIFGRKGIVDRAVLAAEKLIYKAQLEKILDGIFAKVEARIKVNTKLTASGYSNGQPNRANGDRKMTLNGGNPGALDAFNLANSVVLADKLAQPSADPYDYLNNEPAMSDIMSTWTQSLRPYGNWNGNMKNHFYRNLAAAFGGTADPTLVDPVNVHVTTEFLYDLPSPAYPFAVNTSLAKEGEPVYNRYCAQCHGVKSWGSNNEKNFGWRNSMVQGSDVKQAFWLDVGTDLGRARVQNEESIDVMVKALKEGCETRMNMLRTKAQTLLISGAKDKCDTSTDQIGVKAGKVRSGYIPLNLTGIWARSPYLHNGSIPTLAQLLSPPKQRSKSFWRGIPYFDTDQVGFVWSDTQLTQLERSEGIRIEDDYPLRSRFLVNNDGRSNSGHYGVELLNVNELLENPDATPKIGTNANWPAPGTKEHKALLEYLKTL